MTSMHYKNRTTAHAKDRARNALLVGAMVLTFGSYVLAQNLPTVVDVPPSPAPVTEEQAMAIALQKVPGKVTEVAIEKKRGKPVYVVEIQTEKEGEKDVLVDMQSGAVLGTE